MSDNMTVKEMLESMEDAETRDLVDSGEMVVLHEANWDDAEGVVMAHNSEGGQRPMLVKQISDMEFVPNPEWVTFLMATDRWALAKGRDTILWTSLFSEAENLQGQEPEDDSI